MKIFQKLEIYIITNQQKIIYLFSYLKTLLPAPLPPLHSVHLLETSLCLHSLPTGTTVNQAVVYEDPRLVPELRVECVRAGPGLTCT